MYGKIKITKDDLEEMASNFRSNVRGQKIPVDRDHKHEMGAVGWFKELDGPKKVDDGHALFAKIEWNDEGSQYVKGGAFKYFSPHFGPWSDPETGKSYNNVLMSGAITNFPFLKGMQPVSLSEFKEENMDKDLEALSTRMDGFEKKFDTGFAEITSQIKALAEGNGDPPPPDPPPSDPPPSDPPPSDPPPEEEKVEAKLTEMVKAQTADLTKQLTEANTKIALIEQEKRTMKFMEMVSGVGDRPRWVGEADKHIGLLESLSVQFGEDSSQYKDYVILQESHAKQIAESTLFTEVGSAGGGNLFGEDEGISAGVKKLMEADPSLTMAQATERILNEHPEYYNKYDKSQRRRALEVK